MGKDFAGGDSVTEMLTGLALDYTPAKVTSAQVTEALRRRHKPRFNGSAPSWVFLEEVRLGPGFAPGSLQQIDAWAIHTWPSAREMVAYEVKVSRSDFQRELAKPVKRKAALFYSNRFYFAVPKDLIRLDELPPECGLIEVLEDGRTKVTVEAPWRDCHPPSWHFLASIARRVALLTTGEAEPGTGDV